MSKFCFALPFIVALAWAAPLAAQDQANALTEWEGSWQLIDKNGAKIARFDLDREGNFEDSGALWPRRFGGNKLGATRYNVDKGSMEFFYPNAKSGRRDVMLKGKLKPVEEGHWKLTISGGHHGQGALDEVLDLKRIMAEK